ncbi:MAG TPA: hypothetical protein VFW87_10115 [Pirellulales bacterium]|nr:hypothetical protein [Pirellulales bacterium]
MSLGKNVAAVVSSVHLPSSMSRPSTVLVNDLVQDQLDAHRSKFPIEEIRHALGARHW